MNLVLTLAIMAAAAPASKGDRAVRARWVLQKHCAGCHDGTSTKPTLPLLDHGRVTGNRGQGDRPKFVDAERPGASQVLELIEDGSMPPGDKDRLPDDDLRALKDWVADGAVAYPERFDDATVLRWIAADAETSDDPGRYRYLTLHHLVPPSAAPPALADTWVAVKAALAGVSAGKPALTPVDPTETLYRWDLGPAKWDARPFVVLNLEDSSPAGPATLNLFDLVLLEYPFGVPPGGDGPGADVAAKFLARAAQVRPFPSVRADWLAAAVAADGLAADLRALAGVAKADAPRPPPFNQTAPPGAFPPIDGHYAPDPPGPHELVVTALNKAVNEASTFAPGDTLAPQVTAPRAGFIEVTWPALDGTIFVFNLTQDDADKVKGGEARQLFLDPPTRKGYLIDLNAVAGPERLVVYFSEKPFPAGVRVKAEAGGRTVSRFYHPAGRAGDWDWVTRVTRKTLPIRIAK